MSEWLVDFIFDLSLVVVFLVLSPFIISTYVVVKISNGIWRMYLSYVYPDLDFIKETTVRALADTHRNQGIITVMLTIDGEVQFDILRNHLRELVHRRNKNGHLAFPRLQQCLVTRYGSYGWQKCKFDMDSHLILAGPMFKGRVISEANIQDCISDTVAKYLPAASPPWQIVIYPAGNEHYFLIRLHHCILNEGLQVAHFLPLLHGEQKLQIGTEQHPTIKTPFLGVMHRPKHIPYLIERITGDLTNRWNEFISQYDPLESPEMLKTHPGYFQYLAIILITFVSALREYHKNKKLINSDIFSRMSYVATVFDKEAARRDLTITNYVLSIFVTLDPRNIIITSVKTVWWCTIMSMFRVPLMVYHEFCALHACSTLQYCSYPNTVVGHVYYYVPLVYNAFTEILYWLKICFQAPRVLLNDVVCGRDSFQAIPVCGRKVVAWSEPVKTEYLRAIARTTRVSETEILLAATSAAFTRYFVEASAPCPSEIPVTARNINSRFIFANKPNTRPEDAIGGILCLPIPIVEPGKEASVLENLKNIKRNVAKTLNTQPLLFYLTSLQTKYGSLTRLLPGTLLSVILKYMSKKYNVIVTEVTTNGVEDRVKTTWGQEITGAIYFRPPQANICISVCFHQYADEMRVGVMCDAQTMPHHTALTRRLHKHLDDIATAISAK